MVCVVEAVLTLTEFKASRVTDDARAAQATVTRSCEELFSVFAIVPNQVWRGVVSRPELQ